MRQMIIRNNGQLFQAAIAEHGVLQDFFVQKNSSNGLVGNIYLGRAVNVLPGMQAVFVDIGLAKNAFLYIDDLLHPHLEKQSQSKPAVDELIRPGQLVLVQLVKEPLGSKGARVTTHINLPGRFFAFMPEADYVAVSNKITDESDRVRLQHMAKQLRYNQEGIIMRTAASSASEEELQEELLQLREVWDNVLTMKQMIEAPALLHSEANLLLRIIRDKFTEQMDAVWIGDEETYAAALTISGKMAPQLKARIKLDRQQLMFDKLGITKQLQQAFMRRIPLENGGYLIWEDTEALTVIDVNTGKFTGSQSLEDTVFETNMAAAELIARLLRIRNAGGIIIIDFIDMEKSTNKAQILELMQEKAQLDGTKCSIAGWTRLGLMELTRKKIRESNTALMYISGEAGEKSEKATLSAK